MSVSDIPAVHDVSMKRNESSDFLQIGIRIHVNDSRLYENVCGRPQLHLKGKGLLHRSPVRGPIWVPEYINVRTPEGKSVPPGFATCLVIAENVVLSGVPTRSGLIRYCGKDLQLPGFVEACRQSYGLGKTATSSPVMPWQPSDYQLYAGIPRLSMEMALLCKRPAFCSMERSETGFSTLPSTENSGLRNGWS